MNKPSFKKYPLPKLLLYNSFSNDSLILLHQKAELKEAAVYEFYPALLQKAQQRGLFDHLWHSYLIDTLLTDDNLFTSSLSFAQKSSIDSALWDLAAHEIEMLRKYFARPLPPTDLGLIENIVSNMPAPLERTIYGSNYAAAIKDFHSMFFLAPLAVVMDKLADFHYRWGYGDICRFSFFDWQKGLKGIASADDITMSELIGYQHQKDTLMKNTEAFLADKPANNVLLYGQRGTGKSSMVKAIVNKYAAKGLRLVSLSRYSLEDLPEILLDLPRYKQKFIIFLDDLSFDNDEKDYKYIKTYIEGGAAVLPSNVLLYATSNRRHLVAESWHDRCENGEEIHIGDTVSEKLSLAERFGITIHFASPDQEQYLAIVEGIAQNEGLDIDREYLRREALKWERWQNSRSARTARQFINDLMGQTPSAYKRECSVEK
ncbi:MAG: ATP-binding protein [Bacillota bacterium]|jgi:predicted AAA+ superfamily ATPase